MSLTSCPSKTSDRRVGIYQRLCPVTVSKWYRMAWWRHFGDPLAFTCWNWWLRLALLAFVIFREIKWNKRKSHTCTERLKSSYVWLFHGNEMIVLLIHILINLHEFLLRRLLYPHCDETIDGHSDELRF